MGYKRISGANFGLGFYKVIVVLDNGNKLKAFWASYGRKEIRKTYKNYENVDHIIIKSCSKKEYEKHLFGERYLDYDD